MATLPNDDFSFLKLIAKEVKDCSYAAAFINGLGTTIIGRITYDFKIFLSAPKNAK